MRHPAKAIAVAVFVLVPVLLAWYGGSRCEELACIGPPMNAVLHAVTIVPLLWLWLKRGRTRYPVMLVFSEGAMTVATLRHDFDFSPQFMAPAILGGLAVGALAGLAVERLIRRS